jgi:hypothetical protein
MAGLDMQVGVVLTDLEACAILINAFGETDFINGWRVDLVLPVGNKIKFSSPMTRITVDERCCHVQR